MFLCFGKFCFALLLTVIVVLAVTEHITHNRSPSISTMQIYFIIALFFFLFVVLLILFSCNTSTAQIVCRNGHEHKFYLISFPCWDSLIRTRWLVLVASPVRYIRFDCSTQFYSIRWPQYKSSAASKATDSPETYTHTQCICIWSILFTHINHGGFISTQYFFRCLRLSLARCLCRTDRTKWMRLNVNNGNASWWVDIVMQSATIVLFGWFRV